jgi:hypothetical protein
VLAHRALGAADCLLSALGADADPALREEVAAARAATEAAGRTLGMTLLDILAE